MSAAVQERPDIKEQEKKEEEKSHYWHAYCMICNWGKDTITSICGAYKRPRKDMTFHLQPGGDVCIVCEELVKKPCLGCCGG